MTVANSNFSFASCLKVGSVFQEMFPDSDIAKGFSMSSTKVSYMISYGLGPYFLKTLLEDIKDTYFTLQFDETTTVQVKKQMDILIWNRPSTLSASTHVWPRIC